MRDGQDDPGRDDAQTEGAQTEGAQTEGAPTDDAARELNGTSPLERSAAGWTRRGYALCYRDPFLIQLARRQRLGWRVVGLMALALGAAALATTLGILGLRARRWHVISLTRTPDGRVLTHRQWTSHPPEQ